MNLDELKQDAVNELREWIIENPDDDAGDAIFEIADSNTPVYTYDILQLAMDNWEIGTVEPDIGPAFDGSPTPVNIAAANIFEAIEAALWECWREYEDADDEERLDLLNEWQDERG